MQTTFQEEKRSAIMLAVLGGIYNYEEPIKWVKHITRYPGALAIFSGCITKIGRYFVLEENTVCGLKSKLDTSLKIILHFTSSCSIMID